MPARTARATKRTGVSKVLELRSQLPAEQRRLLRLFGRLDEPGRATLLAFAEFMVGRRENGQAAQPDSATVPRAIPRPAGESVVAAIRRLSDTYFMLDRSVLLPDTSSLMAAHLMQGRPAEAVIDELEELFAAHYRRRRPESDD